MTYTKRNSFHYNGKLPLKGTISTKSNGFYIREWFPLKGMASTYGFH